MVGQIRGPFRLSHLARPIPAPCLSLVEQQGLRVTRRSRAHGIRPLLPFTRTTSANNNFDLVAVGMLDRSREGRGGLRVVWRKR